MPFDAHTNLAVSTIATEPAPATSGTTLTVAVGEGARFPAAPFNATVWPATALPTPVNAEVVRVTARTGDVLTITRAQEGTTARSIVAGDLIAATITAKTITDIESGVNFPALTAAGQVAGSHFYSTAGLYYVGAAGSLAGSSDGVWRFLNAASDGFDRVQFGGTTAAYPALKRSGAGLAVRTADDSGPAPLTAASLVVANAGGIKTGTPGTGEYIILQAAPVFGATQSGYIVIGGNTSAVPGGFQIVAGNVPQGAVEFYTGNAALRGKIHQSGGVSWGSATDPGAGVHYFVQAVGATPNLVCVGPGVGQNFPITFQNANGQVGYIGTLASATSYSTTSDARLKTDHGRHTDPDVLRRTVIHAFTWDHDGLPGRGVFAQEAIAVAPFAVTVGTDERDDDGHLKQPWGVDYSKYVPDLITGWQAHDQELMALRAELAALQGTAMRVTPAPYYGACDPPPSDRTSWFSRVRDRIAAWVFPKDPSWV